MVFNDLGLLLSNDEEFPAVSSINLNCSADEDAATLVKMEAYNSQVDSILSNVVGSLPVMLSGEEASEGDCTEFMAGGTGCGCRISSCPVGMNYFLKILH